MFSLHVCNFSGQAELGTEKKPFGLDSYLLVPWYRDQRKGHFVRCAPFGQECAAKTLCTIGFLGLRPRVPGTFRPSYFIINNNPTIRSAFLTIARIPRNGTGPPTRHAGHSIDTLELREAARDVLLQRSSADRRAAPEWETLGSVRGGLDRWL